MNDQGNCARETSYWRVTSPFPGIHFLRSSISRLLVKPDDDFVAVWKDLIANVSDGGVLVVSLSGVEFMATDFLGLLMTARRDLISRGGAIVVCEIPPHLRYVFLVTGDVVRKNFNCVDSAEEAIAKALTLVASG